MWQSSSSFSSYSKNSMPFNNESNDNSNSRSMPKSMEEVWKDIRLSSLHQHYPSSSRGMILQDLFTKDPSSTTITAFPPPPPPPPPPLQLPTMLTLSSAHEQMMNRSRDDHRTISLNHDVVSSLNLQPFDALVSQHINNAGGCGGKKRFPPDFERNSGDRRHKRMMKNRESAARSRARKQAYTNELEIEVAHLLEENARLKKQQQLLYVAAADHQNSRKKCLHRTSTAPF